MLTTILASATVDGETGYAQKVTMGGHEIATDEPVKRGGTNTGPSPFELLLASLGACAIARSEFSLRLRELVDYAVTPMKWDAAEAEDDVAA